MSEAHQRGGNRSIASLEAANEALRKEVDDLRRAYQETASERDEAAELIRVSLPANILAEEDQPFYEVIENPYYSPENILYEVGSRFRDLTGTIIPCESFRALNESAVDRINQWRMTLPDGDETPSMDQVYEAMLEVPSFDESGNKIPEADYKAAVMRAAIIAKNGKKGDQYRLPKTAMPGSTDFGPRKSPPQMTNMRQRPKEAPLSVLRMLERESPAPSAVRRLLHDVA